MRSATPYLENSTDSGTNATNTWRLDVYTLKHIAATFDIICLLSFPSSDGGTLAVLSRVANHGNRLRQRTLNAANVGEHRLQAGFSRGNTAYYYRTCII